MPPYPPGKPWIVRDDALLPVLSPARRLPSARPVPVRWGRDSGATARSRVDDAGTFHTCGSDPGSAARRRPIAGARPRKKSQRRGRTGRGRRRASAKPGERPPHPPRSRLRDICSVRCAVGGRPYLRLARPVPPVRVIAPGAGRCIPPVACPPRPPLPFPSRLRTGPSKRVGAFGADLLGRGPMSRRPAPRDGGGRGRQPARSRRDAPADGSEAACVQVQPTGALVVGTEQENAWPSTRLRATPAHRSARAAGTLLASGRAYRLPERVDAASRARTWGTDVAL